MVKVVVWKRVDETFKQCNFEIKFSGKWHVCGLKATSAVGSSDGNSDFRCDQHKGLDAKGLPTRVHDKVRMLVLSTAA